MPLKQRRHLFRHFCVMAFEGRQVGVIGRTPSQLLELGQTILASLDGATDVDALSTELGRVATREKKTLLFDPQESLALPRRDVEAEGKVRTNVWTRVHVRIAEGHLFSTTTDAERHLTQRFAEAVAKLNRNHGDFLGDLRNAVDAIDPECEMASLWKLLAAVVPGNERTRPVMDPIQGAKRFFEERFLSHVHKVARDCGMPTGRTQDAIRMYVHKKLGPHDTAYPAWALVYVSIRCGDYAAATEFASKAVFPGGCRCETPEYYLRTLMQRPSYVACCRFSELEQACLQFMRHGARKKLSSAYRYMLMSVAFLCGQIHVADTLISESAQSWDSLDEFLWFSLGCVRSGSGPSVPFDYKRLRSRLSSYQEMYYTENGRHPMRYALVLFSGLQFGSALYYLMTQNVEAHSFVVHVVHMAIALHHHGLLELPEAADLKRLKSEDVADLVMHYGHSLAASKSQAAWHYYILTQKIRHRGEQVSNEDKARVLVDLLTRSCDVSVLETSDVLEHSVRSVDERRDIFEMAASQCADRKAFELAVVLYKMIDHVAGAAATCHRLVDACRPKCVSVSMSVV